LLFVAFHGLAITMSCLSVVRIGPTSDNVSAGQLQRAILDFFTKQQPPPPQSPSDDTNDPAAQDCLRVSNRYFDAEILLRRVEDLVVSQDDDDEQTKDSEGLPPWKEDGMILVLEDGEAPSPFDGPSPSSLGALAGVHDRAVAAGGGDLLRLCVAIRVGGQPPEDDPKEYARRIHWCLDRGYEYLPVDLAPEALAQGHDERDKEGFARLVEAVGGTMWSSAVLKKAQAKRLVQSYAQEKQAVTAPVETGVSLVEGNAYVPPDPSMLLALPDTSEEDLDREEKAREALLAQSGMVATPTEEIYLPPSSDDATKPTGSHQENLNPEPTEQQQQREQERIFDNLDAALRQASSIRDMSRTADLSDDDRRQRAGDAAALLMSLMQNSGLDDSEDEDEEEEDAPVAEPEAT
jgi:hypothetical protein